MRVCFVIFMAATTYALGETWEERGFQDFIDGSFNDSGANMFVTAKGSIQMANRWDVNKDGNIDILCVNSHPLVEMLDMSIYWGNGKDFSCNNRSYVPADGPMWVVPADLNKDNATDLVVANYSNGTWTQMDSSIYWGGSDSNAPVTEGWSAYPFKGKTDLPAQNTQGAAVGDLNGDGWPDIVFAFSSGFWEYRKEKDPMVSPSRIYWSREGAFTRENFTELASKGATDVDLADFNQDGLLDIAFANGMGEASYIYLNSQAGFSEAARLELPTKTASAVKAADIDNDGWPDAVFAQESAAVSVAYLNKHGKFPERAKVEFETYTSKDVVVADFNNDGHADVFFTNHQQAWQDEARLGNRVIESFLYYGSGKGFSNEHRKSLQTIGAWGANAADFNGDGWIDLLVCNFQEAYSYEVPSFVYWNSPEGFDVTRRTPLYEHGAQGNAVADFNNDGFLDILITNMMGNSRGDYDPNYLYWGNDKGQYDASSRISLVGREAYEQAFADLDNDGDVDILLLNQGEVARYENECWIYWNKDNAFSTWRITGLPAYKGVGVETADLDRDGYLDIIIGNFGNYVKDGPIDPGSFIYWGGKDGYVISERTALPVMECRGPSIADLNKDHHLDLVFAGPNTCIFWGDGTRKYGAERMQPIPGTFGRNNHQTEIADLNKDGLLDIVFAGESTIIYYGDEKYTYAQPNVLKIPSKTMTIGDVNDDGWLDLVCPLYKIGGKRSADSSVLLGSPQGYNLDRCLKFFTDGGTGSIISDFNFDGYTDLFFFCHRQDGRADIAGEFGDHHTNSRLYWGSAEGFKPENYLPIPSIGAHYDVGIDIGHIANRGFVYEYVSSPYSTKGKLPSQIDWEAVCPPRTSIRFQLRGAATQESLLTAPWTGPSGEDSFYTEVGGAIHMEGKPAWLQYRVLFDTCNGASSPELNAVEISLE